MASMKIKVCSGKHLFKRHNSSGRKVAVGVRSCIFNRFCSQLLMKSSYCLSGLGWGFGGFCFCFIGFFGVFFNLLGGGGGGSNQTPNLLKFSNFYSASSFWFRGKGVFLLAPFLLFSYSQIQFFLLLHLPQPLLWEG